MKKRNNRKILFFVLSALSIMLLAFIFLYEKDKQVAQSFVGTTLPTTLDQPFLGEKDSDVTIVEYGDYACPACQNWSATTFPKLKKEYIDTGKANFSYVNVFFHGELSSLTSLYAETVLKKDSDSYWKFHEDLYNLLFVNGNKISQEDILKIAEKNTNINLVDLEDSISNKAYMNELEKDNNLVEKYDITQTPTVIINGTILQDPFDYEEIEKVILESTEGK
ncbi:DsbA family protein [Ornithinibacillus contaminans]|uniref:DsbA family protein n=1 Tax=Ornithinibacillus contaminans TaxID=694055 RepID=UPI00064DDECB|nr:thioredoxin domain-containing protein [Ornithinibacillus contaminans]